MSVSLPAPPASSSRAGAVSLAPPPGAYQGGVPSVPRSFPGLSGDLLAVPGGVSGVAGGFQGASGSFPAAAAGDFFGDFAAPAPAGAIAYAKP